MAKEPIWTTSEAEQRQKNYIISQKGILETPHKPLYHYTSRDVFWKIIDGESMLARHIMFSNDFHENEIGRRKITKAMEDVAHTKLTATDALPFMVCFCENGDLLSQWRGYAKEGIALEFDFTKGLYGMEQGFSSAHCYTVMNKLADGDYLSADNNTKGTDPNIFMGAVVSPYKVIYTDRRDIPDQSVIDLIKKINTEFADDIQQTAIGMIPYIKNDKFQEEAEYRLIFDMNQLAAGEYRRLLEEKYVNLDVDGVRKPNIRIKFGNQYKAAHEESLTVYYSDEKLSEVMRNFKRKCRIAGISVKPIRRVRKYKIDSKEILISEGKHQEKACYLLRRMLPDKEYKVWCDGHLPIRRIIVGPSRDAEFMRNSIKEYIKTKYWAESIDVVTSQIPLRT